MTFSFHKGMDLAKICISKMVYWTNHTGVRKKPIRIEYIRYILATEERVTAHNLIYRLVFS